jgi:hypothetical protein
LKIQPEVKWKGIDINFKGTRVFEGKRKRNYLQGARRLNLLPGPEIFNA